MRSGNKFLQRLNCKTNRIEILQSIETFVLFTNQLALVSFTGNLTNFSQNCTLMGNFLS